MIATRAAAASGQTEQLVEQALFGWAIPWQLLAARFFDLQYLS
jgi:hypothetical protein